MRQEGELETEGSRKSRRERGLCRGSLAIVRERGLAKQARVLKRLKVEGWSRRVGKLSQCKSGFERKVDQVEGGVFISASGLEARYLWLLEVS